MFIPSFFYFLAIFMPKYAVLLLAVLFLTSCSYATEGSIQDVTVKTPGAHDALCFLYVKDIKYKVRPPQTINIIRHSEDMVVDCKAPGNRHKTIYIEPVISDMAALNVSNGLVPGLAWDYASGALFEYPPLVEVNFENTPVRPMPLPAQNNPDIKQPEDYNLEEFSPSQPRMNADKFQAANPLKRRVRPQPEENFLEDSYAQEEPVMDKGDLMNVIDDLSDDMNPAGSSEQVMPGIAQPIAGETAATVVIKPPSTQPDPTAPPLEPAREPAIDPVDLPPPTTAGPRPAITPEPETGAPVQLYPENE